VIESGKLTEEEGLWLKALRSGLEQTGLEGLVKALRKYGEEVYTSVCGDNHKGEYGKDRGRDID
jgi:hypothetical protein